MMFSKFFKSVKKNISEYKRKNSLPGKYKLFEYYTDKGKELINKKEKQISTEKLFWNLELKEDGEVFCETNLDIPLFSELEVTSWSKARNFVTLLNPNDFRKNIEFQYAFEKGGLKLLKKDVAGNIVVFAFFNRIA